MEDARAGRQRAMAAAAGGFYACVLLVVTPDSVFGVLVSAQALVVTLFGGVGTVWGPVIGAAILIPLAETLNARLGNMMPGIQGVVYGVAIIAIMLAAPEGLFWTIRDRFVAARLTQSPPRCRPGAGAAAVQPSRAGRHRHAAAGAGIVALVRRIAGGDDVSFSVAHGEILGIIGPNGAGKTTLFNLLNGVLTSDAGTALLAGMPMTGRKAAPDRPHGGRTHLSGRAQLPAPAAAGQRGGRCLRRRRWTTGTRSRRPNARWMRSACMRSRRRALPGSSPTRNCG